VCVIMSVIFSVCPHNNPNYSIAMWMIGPGFSPVECMITIIRQLYPNDLGS